MKTLRNQLLTVFCLLVTSLTFGQQAFYDVIAAEGNGVRFWNSDIYKLSMGNSADYHFGPVSNFSIKFNMNNQVDRGWTWGVATATPIAALSTEGQMQLAGSMSVGPHRYLSTGFTGKLYLSGAGTELSFSNRSLTGGLIMNPINGERFAFYTDGPTTDGELNLWSGFDMLTVRKDGKIGINNGSPTARLDVVGGGNQTVDLKVNGRIMTGDANTNGGIFLNSTSSMFIGQGATNMVFNNGGSRMIIGSNGHVGIGTGGAAPGARLDVIGSGGQTIDMKVNGRLLSGDANNMGGLWVSSGQTMLVGAADATKVGFWNNGYWRLYVHDTGNVTVGGKVGVGTHTPDEQLTVKGKIHTQEVRVDLTGAVAPDYVFEKDYTLPSLEQVKEYIDQHHHLPEVPSAKEIESNGIQVGEMNLLLLKKIEELTLYVIELKQQNERQEQKINKLEASRNK